MLAAFFRAVFPLLIGPRVHSFTTGFRAQQLGKDGEIVEGRQLELQELGLPSVRSIPAGREIFSYIGQILSCFGDWGSEIITVPYIYTPFQMKSEPHGLFGRILI